MREAPAPPPGFPVSAQPSASANVAPFAAPFPAPIMSFENGKIMKTTAPSPIPYPAHTQTPATKESKLVKPAVVVHA